MASGTDTPGREAEIHKDSVVASPWGAAALHDGGKSTPELNKWQIGFLSVDLKGRPILDKAKTGGWLAAPFIFGNECAEKMVYYGFSANFISYLMYVMHNSFRASSTILSNWTGASNVTPLIGGFIADTYLGRFWTICVFGMIYLLGLIVLTLHAIIPDLHPKDRCDIVQLALGKCPPPAKQQMAFLYVALYVIALGAGGLRPLIAPFGADQFDVYDPKEKKAMSVFFNMFYFFFALGILFAVTVVVYISENFSWGWGIGTLALAMAISNILFFVGTPRYRHKLPSGSPLTRVAQVISAAYRKRSVASPIVVSELYEVYDKESAIVGSGKLTHTTDYRFLDKAAIIDSAEVKLAEDGTISPWRLCTVTQVEELKAMLNLVPIWFTCIFLNTMFFQVFTLSVLQAITLDRKIGNFTMPPGSAPAFSISIVICFIPAYDAIYVPLMRRITGHERGTTVLQRIGIGNFIAIFTVLIAGFVEHKRREIALAHPQKNPLQPVPLPYSVFWLVFQYFFLGMSEVFAGIGQIELFYDQAPDGMRAIGGALLSLATAAGSFLSTLLTNLVQEYTARDEKPGWLADDINSGHVDYHYWTMSGIAAVNFLVFLVVSRRYKYKIQAERTIPIGRNPASNNDEYQNL